MKNFKITITENDILKRPNVFELGDYIQKLYWKMKSDLLNGRSDDENKLIHFQNDKCIICGQKTPYPHSTHITQREGYIEGAGQSCFQPKICEK